MKSVHVRLKDKSYDICMGDSILSKFGSRLKSLKLGQDALIITSPNITKLHGKVLVSGLKKHGFIPKVFEVPDGEKSKSVKCAFDLMERIAKYDVLKQPFIIAFGGGVIGDLAGYVAAAYKRGIPYVQVPTTFLAQIDSAIGGKVAIDLPVGKNLVGAFHQPKVVCSDVSVLTTLSKRQIRNGLAEAVKYGVIYDKKLFEMLEDNYDFLLEADIKMLAKVVERSSQIKARVVERDQFETKGIRTILNFGHTIGHAIEAAGKFKLYQHGEAIALGMRIAAVLSVEINQFSKISQMRLNDLLTNIGLPEKINKMKLVDIMRLMLHDKKFQSGQNKFVLALNIGKVNVVEGVSEKLIINSIKKFF